MDESDSSSISRTRSMKETTLNDFFIIVEDGEMEKIKEYLQNNPDYDLNRFDHHGRTVLHVAAAAGHCDVIEYLISRGADITMFNKKGDHVLHTSARMGSIPAIQLLKDIGVDLNLKNKDGETALHLATRSNHLHVMEFLCSHGADVNTPDKNGEVPLHVACWCDQQPRTCEILCKYRCNMNIKNKEGEAPIHFAAGRGNLECVKILMSNGADIDIVDKRGSTCLHLTCRRNHLDIAMLLLRAGCQVDVIDQLGETPLHPACHHNLIPVVQTMCAYGCRVDVVNKSGSCPLHISTRTGHIEAVRCLLLSGVPAHQTNQNGITAEVMAISQGHNEIAELIGGLKDKQVEYIRQLLPDEIRIERIKIKLFGNSGVGKTVLIESLKCGFFGSLLRKAGLGQTANNDNRNVYCLNTGLGQQKEGRIIRQQQEQQMLSSNSLKIPKKKSAKASKASVRKISTDYKMESLPEVTNPNYTKGISIQQTNLPGVGDVSIWEFSGYGEFLASYDHFIGDSSCLHLVLFKCSDSSEEQLRQITFWMEFIRIRLPTSESIGKMGRSLNPCQVLLVATHATEVKDDQNNQRSKMNSLHFQVVQIFSKDFSIYPKILVVDSSQSMSADMKLLKTVLNEVKIGVLQHIPATSHFFQASVAELPHWQKNLASLPVVTWSNFKDYIRLNVNLLACEEHLRSLVYFLQLTGEIAFLEAHKLENSLVIINPRWLGQELIPKILDRNTQLAKLHPDGIFLREELFQNVFRGDCGDIYGSVKVLQAMELICILEEEHIYVLYEIPGLNRLSRPPERDIWDPEDVRYLNGNGGGEGVFGGLRLVSLSSRYELRSIFPRIQFHARQHYDLLKAIDRSDNEESDNDELRSRGSNIHDLTMWFGGFKCTKGNLEVLVLKRRNEKDEWIEIKARGQKETSNELFQFFHETLNIIISAVERCAPTLEFHYHFMSPHNLSQYKDNVDVFLPRNIFLAQKNGKERLSIMETLRISDLKSESVSRESSVSVEDSAISSISSIAGSPDLLRGELLVDIMAFGSSEAYKTLIPGADISLRFLPVGLRRRLCALLDPPNPTGQDWCLLSVFLGQSDDLPLIDCVLKEAFSRTDQVLRRWSLNEEKPTVRMLMEKLDKIGRTDAIEVLVDSTPLYKLVDVPGDVSIQLEILSSGEDASSVPDSKEGID